MRETIYNFRHVETRKRTRHYVVNAIVAREKNVSLRSLQILLMELHITHMHILINSLYCELGYRFPLRALNTHVSLRHLYNAPGMS